MAQTKGQKIPQGALRWRADFASSQNCPLGAVVFYPLIWFLTTLPNWLLRFIALPFVNPTLTLQALCLLMAFLPERVILWFTHSPAKLLQSMNLQCSKDVLYMCLCEWSLLYLPVQNLNLISSCYRPQWVKARLNNNLLAYSDFWSALPQLHLSFKWKTL